MRWMISLLAGSVVLSATAGAQPPAGPQPSVFDANPPWAGTTKAATPEGILQPSVFGSRPPWVEPSRVAAAKADAPLAGTPLESARAKLESPARSVSDSNTPAQPWAAVTPQAVAGPRFVSGLYGPPTLPRPPAPNVQVDAGKLRALAHVPVVKVSFNLRDPRELAGGPWHGAPPDPAVRIAALQEAMQGDEQDAERYLELAQLYEQAGCSAEECAAAKAKARALFEERLHEEPWNGAWHAQYATALWPDSAAAEKPALEAVRLAPAEWHCWLILGQLRHWQMLETLYGSRERALQSNHLGLQAMCAEIAALKPSDEQCDRAEQFLRLALECLDRAVAVGPAEVEAWQWRSAYQIAALFWRHNFRQMRQLPPLNEPAELARTNLLRDARRMAVLCPDNPDFLGHLAMVHYWQAGIDKSNEPTVPAPGEVLEPRAWLPPAALEVIDGVMARLTALSSHEDSEVAASACRQLAQWQILLGTPERAAERAWQAVRLQAAGVENWEVLLACYTTSKQYPEAYFVARKLVARFPTERSYLQLGEICARLGRRDEAETNLRAALEKAPDGTASNLALAALLLAHDGQAALAEVGECLDRVHKLLTPQSDRTLRIDYWTHRAIFLAQVGRVEESRQILVYMNEHGAADECTRKALALFMTGPAGVAAAAPECPFPRSGPGQ
jgi:hypothetical protein